MKHGILLILSCVAITHLEAQKKQKAKPITAFAITAAQKGQNSWTEVRLIDVTTGEEIRTIYQSSQEVPLLNARTGKPVVLRNGIASVPGTPAVAQMPARQVETSGGEDAKHVIVRHIRQEQGIPVDRPFATTSAACAFDKKHNRLYYTPMGINQLRYIDLKSKTPKIYYFEDEPFGTLKGTRDVPNQITRMVIGPDGNGYALTNDANHLIRFSTGKRPVITDLGPLTDDPANNQMSVHGHKIFGGDMVASASGHFYLIGANRAVFKIDMNTRIATYMGKIKGLPKGYSTNGAIVEGEKTVIVSSSSSTLGYYRFDIGTLQAEKVSAAEAVFNASDLANGVLLKENKQREEEQLLPEQVPSVASAETLRKPAADFSGGVISVFPNPVTNGYVRLSFANQPAGRYQIQVLDASGKLITGRGVTITNRMQVEEVRLPGVIAGGQYLIKVQGEKNKVFTTTPIVVQ